MHNWCEKTSRSAKKTAKTIINMNYNNKNEYG